MFQRVPADYLFETVGGGSRSSNLFEPASMSVRPGCALNQVDPLLSFNGQSAGSGVEPRLSQGSGSIPEEPD